MTTAAQEGKQKKVFLLLFLQKKKNPYFLPLALLLLALIIHAPALNGFFAADDFVWLRHNTWQDAARAVTGTWGIGTAFRPITRASLVLSAQLYRWNDTPWHLENILLHALNGILLAAVCRRASMAAAASLAAGALFVAMPFDWENVDLISGRTGLLCLAAMLTAVWCWHKGGPYLPAACAAQAAAICCYEPGLILPAIIAALAPVWHRTGIAPRTMPRRLAIITAAAALTWSVRAVALGTPGVALDMISPHPLAEAARNLGRILFYIAPEAGPIGAAAAIILLAAGLLNRTTRIQVVALLAAAVIAYLPFIAVIGTTDRFVYLATAPLAVACVASARAVRWPRILLATLFLACCVSTFRQAQHFAAAGDRTRLILDRAIAASRDLPLSVFDNIPTQDGKYYLLRDKFADAIAARTGRPAAAVLTDDVLNTPALSARVQANQTEFFRFDPNSNGFIPITAQAWRRANGVPTP